MEIIKYLIPLGESIFVLQCVYQSCIISKEPEQPATGN